MSSLKNLENGYFTDLFRWKVQFLCDFGIMDNIILKDQDFHFIIPKPQNSELDSKHE